MITNSKQARTRVSILPIKRRSVWSAALCTAVLTDLSEATCDPTSMNLFIQFGDLSVDQQPDHVAFQLGSGSL